MAAKRTRYSAEFKAKVPLEALRGELTAAQLAVNHGIHQTMVGEWKRQAKGGPAAVFLAKSAESETANAVDADVEKLHAKRDAAWADGAVSGGVGGAAYGTPEADNAGQPPSCQYRLGGALVCGHCTMPAL